MSRNDIANYLVINSDTLSRTMMRFCDCGLIERQSRHAIRVVDLDELSKKSPISSLLFAVFMTKMPTQEVRLGLTTETSAFFPSISANRSTLPALTADPLSHFSTVHHYAG